MESVKRRWRAALIVFLFLISFTMGHSLAATLLPWVRIGGTYQVTAGIGTGLLTFNTTIKEVDYENGDVWKSNVPGVETIYGARVVLSGAVRTGDYSFNGAPANPDDVTLSIISPDGYVYYSAILSDSTYAQLGANFVWMNQYLDANNPATLNLRNVVLRPNGDDGLHPSRYLTELAAYLGSSNVSGLKMQFFVPSSGNFKANSTGAISFGLLDGLKTLIAPPSGLNATALSSSRIDFFWTDNSNNEAGFKIDRKTGVDGTYSQIALVGANATAYSDTGVTAGTSYYYKIRAYNSSGDSDYSNEANAATESPPSITINPATNLNGSSASLNATVNPNGPDATVYFECGAGTSYNISTISQSIGNGTSDVTVTDELINLSPDTAYHCRAVVINLYGTFYSNDISFITPPITLTVISPVDGSTINRPYVMVRGTVVNTTGSETGVAVNGIVATGFDNQFMLNHIPLKEGLNKITITATDTGDKTATTSITVNAVTTLPHVALKANIESGTPPLITYFSLSTEINNSADTYQIDYEGDGTIDYTGTNFGHTSYTYMAEGIYFPTATVTDDQGTTYTDTIVIVVLDQADVDTLLRGKWSAMKTALVNRDIEMAVVYFIDRSKEKYRTVFGALIDQLPVIAGTFVEFSIVEVYHNMANYKVVADENGVRHAYPGVLIKDKNGIWKFKDF